MNVVRNISPVSLLLGPLLMLAALCSSPLYQRQGKWANNIPSATSADAVPCTHTSLKKRSEEHCLYLKKNDVQEDD